MKSQLCALAVASALVPSVLVLGSAAPASATPLSCSKGFNAAHTVGWAECTAGSGTVQAVVKCVSGTGQSITVNGPHTSVPGRSRGSAPATPTRPP